MKHGVVLLLLASAAAAQGFQERAAAIAQALPKEIARQLDKHGSGDGRRRPRSFLLLARAPFALCVERRDAAKDAALADRTMERLQAFDGAFNGFMGTGPVADTGPPLTVVLLQNRAVYEAYLKGMTGTHAEFLSHYEPLTRRVVLHRNAPSKDLCHEATHLLLAASRKVTGAPHGLPLWFEEGLAEWMAGGRLQVVNGARHWTPGALQRSHVATAAAALADDRHLSLKQLLDATVATRDGWLENGDKHTLQVAYAQSWSLFHFLNHYAVDRSGRVAYHGGRLGPGIYKAGLGRYAALQINGRDGRPFSGRPAFQRALELSDAQVAQLEQAYHRWIRWTARKVAKGQVRDGRLVPAVEADDTLGG